MSNFNYFKFNKDFSIEENEYELSICKRVEQVLMASEDGEVRRLVQPLRTFYMESKIFPRAIGRIEMYIDQNAHKFSDDIEFQWLSGEFSGIVTEIYHL